MKEEKGGSNLFSKYLKSQFLVIRHLNNLILYPQRVRAQNRKLDPSGLISQIARRVPCPGHICSFTEEKASDMVIALFVVPVKSTRGPEWKCEGYQGLRGSAGWGPVSRPVRPQSRGKSD